MSQLASGSRRVQCKHLEAMEVPELAAARTRSWSVKSKTFFWGLLRAIIDSCHDFCRWKRFLSLKATQAQEADLFSSRRCDSSPRCRAATIRPFRRHSTWFHPFETNLPIGIIIISGKTYGLGHACDIAKRHFNTIFAIKEKDAVCCHHQISVFYFYTQPIRMSLNHTDEVGLTFHP